MRAPKPYEDRRRPTFRAPTPIARRGCLECTDGILRGRHEGTIWARVCGCGRVASLAAPSERERMKRIGEEDAAE